MQIKMRISLTSQTNTIGISKAKSTIAFRGNSNGLSEDKFELRTDDALLADKISSNQKMFKFYESIRTEFPDRIDLENAGTKVELPNSLMFVSEDSKSTNLLIDWVKNKSDCHFVKLADSNNEKLQDVLWDELQKAQETFQDTKERTLIHVEDFQRLINPKTNTFENIESLKDIMGRTASDFGTTLIFDTKDASQLNSEAIQPHRVAKINVTPAYSEIEEYQKLLNRKDEIIAHQNPKPKTVKKDELKTKEEVKTSPEPSITLKPEAPEKPPEPPSKPKPETPNKPPEIPKTPEVPKGNGKTVAIIAAAGAAIVGLVYLISNSNKKQGTKNSANL